MSRSRTYHIWQRIKQRCHDVNFVDYPDYGGRGIAMHEPWRHSFEAFFADVGVIPDGMEIDRVDNERPYEPGNIRFATRRQQMQNMRRSKWWVVDGVRYGSATAAAEATGISASQIGRMCLGYTHNETGNWIPPKAGCTAELKYPEVRDA
jgi:hypothetical protein